MSLPVISWRQCVKALEKIGFVVVREKRHLIMQRDDPPPLTTIPIPKHKTIEAGTLRSIIRQSGLRVEEFNDLLKKELTFLFRSIPAAFMIVFQWT